MATIARDSTCRLLSVGIPGAHARPMGNRVSAHHSPHSQSSSNHPQPIATLQHQRPRSSHHATRLPTTHGRRNRPHLRRRSICPPGLRHLPHRRAYRRRHRLHRSVSRFTVYIHTAANFRLAISMQRRTLLFPKRIAVFCKSFFAHNSLPSLIVF